MGEQRFKSGLYSLKKKKKIQIKSHRRGGAHGGIAVCKIWKPPRGRRRESLNRLTTLIFFRSFCNILSTLLCEEHTYVLLVYSICFIKLWLIERKKIYLQFLLRKIIYIYSSNWLVLVEWGLTSLKIMALAFLWLLYMDEARRKALKQTIEKKRVNEQ